MADEQEVEIWHRANSKYVDRVLKEGLKPQQCLPSNVVMDDIAKKQGVLKVSRCKSTYGYFQNECPIPRPESVVISVKVDPKTVYVGDMDVSTEAMMLLDSPNPEHQARGKMFALRFYEELMTLDQYLKLKKKPYMIAPEILIPYEVSPDKLKMVQPCSEERT